MLSEQEPDLSVKELIARVIDPVSFEKVRQGGDWPDAQWRCDRALDKAAHILALIQAGRDERKEGGDCLREAGIYLLSGAVRGTFVFDDGDHRVQLQATRLPAAPAPEGEGGLDESSN